MEIIAWKHARAMEQLQYLYNYNEQGESSRVIRETLDEIMGLLDPPKPDAAPDFREHPLDP
ncbi:hypothetical protein FACS189479_04880 [Spirochaetia bacterium]|nr:hypothetical protein FACS189479_04880 [Spirochaetia bacterium]